jgi:hypothetical protein
MRAELRGIDEDDWWVYGLGVDDLDYTLEIARELIADTQTAHAARGDQLRRDDPENAAEILDDLGYYAVVRTAYLWHFCLWRLQAILEGLIVYKFVPRAPAPRRLVGLQAKLIAARAAGLVLNQDEEDELLRWGRLRNALSHAPPERVRPGPLREDDVIEYHALVRGLVQRWEAQARTP